MGLFTGKVALVTGATSGIGRETAIAFGKAGAKVVLAGRRQKEGEEAAEAVRAAGGDAIFATFDAAIESESQKLVETVLTKFGRLDAAFNNAGVEGDTFLHVTHQTFENYKQVMDINVGGVLWSMKYQIPAMHKTGGGSIVNTASVAGSVGMGGMSVYVASKHAVIGLTRAAALEHAAAGIRINAVSPAVIETPMFERFSSQGSILDTMTKLHPIGRIGQPSEVADAVLWLCSPQASFVIGQDIRIDGGYTVQ